MAEELRIVVQDDGGTGEGESSPVVPSSPSAPQAGPGTSPDGTDRFPSALETSKLAFLDDAIGLQRGAFASLTPAVVGVSSALAGVTVAAGATVVALKLISSTIERQADIVEAFSPDVARARASSEARRQQLVVERSQRIGPRLARAEDVRNRFEELQFKVMTDILDVLLRVVDHIEPLQEAASGAGDTLEQMNSIIEGLPAPLLAAQTALFPFLTVGLKVFTQLRRYIRGLEDEEDEISLDINVQELINSLPRDANNNPLFWPDGLDSGAV